MRRTPSFRQANRASLHLQARHLRADLEVEVTPAGLAAIGLLVSGILLSVVPIVWVSTRKLPDRK